MLQLRIIGKINRKLWSGLICLSHTCVCIHDIWHYEKVCSPFSHAAMQAVRYRASFCIPNSSAITAQGPTVRYVVTYNPRVAQLKGPLGGLWSNLLPRAGPNLSDISPGSSGLSPVRSWQPPRMKPAQPLWGACSSVWEVFSLISSWILLYFPLSIVLPLCTSVTNVALSFLWLPNRHEEVAIRSLPAFFSQGWTRPFLLFVLTGQMLQLSPSWWPSPDLTPVYWCLFCTLNPQTACITPDAAAEVPNKWQKSLPLICWLCFCYNSLGCWWPLCCWGRLLAHALLAVSPDPQDLFCRAVPNQSIPIPCHCEGLFFPGVGFDNCPCYISWGSCWPFLQPPEVPLSDSPALKHLDSSLPVWFVW